MVYQLSITSIAGSLGFTITFYNRTEKLYLHFSAIRSPTNKELVATGYEDGIINRCWWTLLLIRQIINPISQSDQFEQPRLVYSNKTRRHFSLHWFNLIFFRFRWYLSRYVMERLKAITQIFNQIVQRNVFILRVLQNSFM